ncbi:unnamed protein product [Mycena citricolor]|uniref:Uncharacterized protein n=1 Tax=Mycena citricolor TaxID=2018698 RepID=A0AAD2K5J4_9AGAR|nr:unnamed protein product [Mycena citricolor]
MGSASSRGHHTLDVISSAIPASFRSTSFSSSQSSTTSPSSTSSPPSSSSAPIAFLSASAPAPSEANSSFSNATSVPQASSISNAASVIRASSFSNATSVSRASQSPIVATSSRPLVKTPSVPSAPAVKTSAAALSESSSAILGVMPGSSSSQASSSSPPRASVTQPSSSPTSHAPATTSSKSDAPSPSVGVKPSTTPAASSSKSIASPINAPPQTKATAQTTTSTVHITPSTTSTSTSTTTVPPTSTLSSQSLVPVVVTSGVTSFFAPPLVTVLWTSTEPNGSFVTVTNVAANPTAGFSQIGASTGKSGFFHHSGAVAGVFLVVGALVSSFLAYLTFLYLRARRRKRDNHRRWLMNVNRPRGPAAEPQTLQTAQVGDEWSRIPAPHYAPHRASFSQGLGIYHATPRRNAPPAFEEPGEPHSRQSSPSIYPASLPEEGSPVMENSPVSGSSLLPVPPRPPRSQLRSVRIPVTPPQSVSSHSPTSVEDSGNPFVDGNRSPVQQGYVPLDDLMRRPTLLDVRSEAGSDIVRRSSQRA